MRTEHGLTRRLGRDLLLQAVYISLAVVVGVYAAAQLMENVLIEQALKGEAEYYWERELDAPGGPLPDTKNMTGYREGYGRGVPADLIGLPEGYHRRDEPLETLTLVSEQGGERLYLVFEVGQVDDLVFLFGILPLAVVLIVIYISLLAAYRVSRRAVSPVVSLARQVQQLEPSRPDASLLAPDPEFETDDEIRVLTEALRGLIGRVSDFAERERRFTRDASHELRTPLTVIKMAVDRLLKQPDLDSAQEETLLRIRNSATDMQELTAAFLLLARESGKDLAGDWHCVNDIVAAELERARIIDPDSRITAFVDERCRLLVSAPGKVLESVIGNLLRNALAYTDEGQVKVSIDAGTVTIEDTGPGMEPGEVEQVFQPYYRNQRQRGGYGVGLTIVKRLTDRFGWPVSIESAPAQGTRVLLEFPESRNEPLTPAD